MNVDIGENFLLYETAQKILKAMRKTCSSYENTSKLFAIESILHDLRQGDLTVTQYFNTLTRHWHQLDMFESHQWNCPEDNALYLKIVEQKRVFKFLMGLNKDLDDVRGRVMGTKPLPSLREGFFEVSCEESRKKVMIGGQHSSPTLEGHLLPVAHALKISKILIDKGKEDLGVIIVLNLATLRTHVGRYTANQLIGDHPSQILIETAVQGQPLQSRNNHSLLNQVLSPRNNLKCSKSF